MIHALEAERESVNTQLEQTITHEQLDDLQIFAANIAEGLCEADEEFETRRRMLDYLHVKVEFSLEEGVEVAQLSCEFGLNKKIPLNEVPNSTCRNSSHQPESELSSSSREGEAGNYMPNYMHSMDCRRS